MRSKPVDFTSRSCHPAPHVGDFFRQVSEQSNGNLTLSALEIRVKVSYRT